MTAPAALANALADRYRFDRELGVGGMATVYLAEDRKHAREIAIKVLRPDVAETLGRERFLREIQLAARLNHPHILPLYDSGEAGGFLYFVMPVMQGRTLRDHLAQGNPMPLETALRIVAEVADALDYAHRHGIVHRDIKPENILLHEGHAVVADFGIGKAIVAASSATGALFTQMGVTVGTPAYMSPEQAAGEDIDGRSDLFALGCVVYEMLTGEVAFTAPSVHGVLSKRFVYSPPPITASQPDIPALVSDTVTRLLQRRREDRFASGAEVIAALRTGPSTGTPAVSPATKGRSETSIVVLPFANLGADPDNEYFSDGLTEELITDLAGVKALRVISRTSSMQMKGTNKGMREIGHALGVRYALTGSARKAGSALRITAQLVDTATDEQIWAEKYSGTMDDVFDVQERVSRAIVSALRLTLSASEDHRLAERPIKDARAYEIYLKAQSLVRRYGASMDHVNALLEQAIAIEGLSPPLRALRAYVWVTQVRAGVSTDAGHLARAEAEARALMQLVPNAAYGYSLLGFISYERGELPETERYLKMALERDRTDADAWFFRGIALTAAGQGDASVAVARQFIEADPLSPMAGVLLNSAHWFLGNPSEGLDRHEQGLLLDPENPIIHWSLGYAYLLLDRVADARVHAGWMQAHAPQIPYTTQLLALLQAIDGRCNDARAILAGMDQTAFDAHITFHLSESVGVAGDTESALRLLALAVERGFYPYDYIAAHCPFLARVRGTPEFRRIADRAAVRVSEFRA